MKKILWYLLILKTCSSDDQRHISASQLNTCFVSVNIGPYRDRSRVYYIRHKVGNVTYKAIVEKKISLSQLPSRRRVTYNTKTVVGRFSHKHKGL